MFTIRAAHREAFAWAAVEAFEERMLVHLRTYFPDQLQACGEERAREWIQHGIRRAADHGIVARCDVCKYIDLMFVFGHDFDTDPRLPWARAILESRDIPSAKTKRLYDAAVSQLSQSG